MALEIVDLLLRVNAVQQKSLQKSPWRYVYLALGCVCVGLAFIGVWLPLMPTTVFLICAAALFARSSPRLEAWLLDHPRFGALLQAWRVRGAIPSSAKRLALLGMTVGFVIFIVFGGPSLTIVLLVAIGLSAVTAFIYSRPDT